MLSIMKYQNRVNATLLVNAMYVKFEKVRLSVCKAHVELQKSSKEASFLKYNCRNTRHRFAEVTGNKRNSKSSTI